MKYLVALVVGLAGTLVLGMPAEAQSRRGVVLTQPSAHHVGGSVVITGKVQGRARAVRIEQRKAGRWVVVRKAKVRKGAYKTTVKTAGKATKLRATSAGRYSRVVWVPAKKPAVVVPLFTAPTPAPSLDDCGVRPAKSDGSLWSCTFNDDFSAADLDRTKWVPQTQFASGVQAAHACYLDDPSVVSQSNGALNLSVRKVATPVSCTFGGMSGPTSYVAGGVMTHHLFSQQYGRFEARIKSTATRYPGLHEAFWLWPDDRVASTAVWPYAGEVDISETYSVYPNLSIPFVHYSADALGAVPGLNTAWSCAAPRGSWNTYTLDWSATRMEIKVNGKTCLVNTSGNAAFKKPYIVALTQLLGAAGNVYDGRTPLPATMNVDYVKVWN